MFNKNFKHIRLKFYSKSADKLTSLGVSSKGIRDPWSTLLLTTDKRLEAKYNRQLFSCKGFSTTRVEVSFYGSELKKPALYKHIIK